MVLVLFISPPGSLSRTVSLVQGKGLTQVVELPQCKFFWGKRTFGVQAIL